MDTAKSLGLNCGGVKFWAMIATDWYHLLLCVNPIINFFIYCYFSKEFQKVLASYLVALTTFCPNYGSSDVETDTRVTFLLRSSIRPKESENLERNESEVNCAFSIQIDPIEI